MNIAVERPGDTGHRIGCRTRKTVMLSPEELPEKRPKDVMLPSSSRMTASGSTTVVATVSVGGSARRSCWGSWTTSVVESPDQSSLPSVAVASERVAGVVARRCRPAAKDVQGTSSVPLPQDLCGR